MARLFGPVFVVVGVVGLLVGIINAHIEQGIYPHTTFGSVEYVFYGPFSAVSALGIYGGTVVACYGLAMVIIARQSKRV